jgi:hypothetical protein
MTWFPILLPGRRPLIFDCIPTYRCCEGKQVCCWRAWAQAGKIMVRYVASWPKPTVSGAKPLFLLVFMAKMKLSASLLPLGARDCEG